MHNTWPTQRRRGGTLETIEAYYVYTSTLRSEPVLVTLFNARVHRNEKKEKKGGPSPSVPAFANYASRPVNELNHG